MKPRLDRADSLPCLALSRPLFPSPCQLAILARRVVIRYAFIDYPIAQLHPDAFRAHEAANCAGEQGKYWEMNSQLFEQPARDVPTLVTQAGKVGVNTSQFKSCLEGGKFAAPVRESISRMQALGIDSTPTFLLGVTPSPGQPMKIVKVVKGAVPFADFQAALDSMLK